jgi:carboxypeptidase C (cathepsin A)
LAQWRSRLFFPLGYFLINSGFLQEIGPYFLDEGVRYKVGDELVENPYSWHKESHLLFLESPPGVGYSINNDSSYAYNDASTLVDNFDALLDFFVKYPEYSDNIFWIAGESYAGKYIPDLATFIDVYNTFESKKINLKGILVGNGVMSFLGGTLESNRIEYLVNQEFVDPDLLPYYRGSCLIDPESAGCQYFKTRYYQFNSDFKKM